VKVVNSKPGTLRHIGVAGYRVTIDRPNNEVFISEREIPRVRMPIKERPPAAYPRLIVRITTPDGVHSDRRAEIQSNEYRRVVIVIETPDGVPILPGTTVELLRYEI
jgi:hypothetical protein